MQGPSCRGRVTHATARRAEHPWNDAGPDGIHLETIHVGPESDDSKATRLQYAAKILPGAIEVLGRHDRCAASSPTVAPKKKGMNMSNVPNTAPTRATGSVPNTEPVESGGNVPSTSPRAVAKSRQASAAAPAPAASRAKASDLAPNERRTLQYGPEWIKHVAVEGKSLRAGNILIDD